MVACLSVGPLVTGTTNASLRIRHQSICRPTGRRGVMGELLWRKEGGRRAYTSCWSDDARKRGQVLYDGLLQRLLAEATADAEVVGVLLTGSLARGDALPGTDVDLRVILADGVERAAVDEVREGVMVEWGFPDEA